MAVEIESLPLSCNDVLQCRFESWYRKFRENTFPSEIIPLSDEFLSYLQEDGIHLPAAVLPPSESSLSGWSTVEPGEKLTPPFELPEQPDSDSDSDSDSNSDSDDDPANEPGMSVSRFPELDERIDEALALFGGKVFPKFTWSAPNDGTWLNENNSLKCTDTLQLYLLLKASDRVSYDITSPFDRCHDHRATVPGFPEGLAVQSTQGGEMQFQHCLVLRQWYALNLGMEFRCFVRGKKLIAVSQRHDDMFFEFLVGGEAKILTVIKQFVVKKVLPKWSMAHFVLDLYVDQKDRVWIVDFNPWNPPVISSALFTWTELHTWEAEKEPRFRIVLEQGQIRPRQGHENRAPIDLLKLIPTAAS